MPSCQFQVAQIQAAPLVFRRLYLSNLELAARRESPRAAPSAAMRKPRSSLLRVRALRIAAEGAARGGSRRAASSRLLKRRRLYLSNLELAARHESPRPASSAAISLSLTEPEGATLTLADRLGRSCRPQKPRSQLSAVSCLAAVEGVAGRAGGRRRPLRKERNAGEAGRRSRRQAARSKRQAARSKSRVCGCCHAMQQ